MVALIPRMGVSRQYEVRRNLFGSQEKDGPVYRGQSSLELRTQNGQLASINLLLEPLNVLRTMNFTIRLFSKNGEEVSFSREDLFGIIQKHVDSNAFHTIGQVLDAIDAIAEKEK